MQSTEQSGREYFDRLNELSTRATQQTGSREHWLRIGGRSVCLKLAHAEFENTTLPALRHLEVPAKSSADLTVHAWDSAAAGFEPPPWPWATPDGRPYLFARTGAAARSVPDLQAIFRARCRPRAGRVLDRRCAAPADRPARFTAAAYLGLVAGHRRDTVHACRRRWRRARRGAAARRGRVGQVQHRAAKSWIRRSSISPTIIA